ncbi:hypothetical protein predicted by Glimmer/Critica [Sorangium cellulosum So ce56]|uniref:Uncharacterized protein n=2 Tax=Sorangium cellulosum TaxID=56 RepID=A9GFX5_SORC5|nr:hypothetical protein predicted by Glimmer/Critica [Sorangium cellulosum So ce56]
MGGSTSPPRSVPRGRAELPNRTLRFPRFSAPQRRFQEHLTPQHGLMLFPVAYPGSSCRTTGSAELPFRAPSGGVGHGCERTQHGWRYIMTRAALARVSAPLALRQVDNCTRMVERTFPDVPARGSCPPRGLAQPVTATATLAIPLDGLTITAPQPEMLSQKNVESVTGIPARVFLDTIRAPGFPLPVTKFGKLRLIQREAFVAYLQALACDPASRRSAEADERTRVAAGLKTKHDAVPALAVRAANDAEHGSGAAAVLQEVGLVLAPMPAGRRRRERGRKSR